MTCPRCHCAECRRAVVNERLRKFIVSRETPVDAPDQLAEQLALAVVDDLARVG